MSSYRRKNRNRLEIIFDILRVCWKPVLKTQIMYRATLSFKQLNEYLDFVEKKGLIVKRENHWKITRKGLRYMRIFERIQGLLKENNSH